MNNTFDAEERFAFYDSMRAAEAQAPAPTLTTEPIKAPDPVPSQTIEQQEETPVPTGFDPSKVEWEKYPESFRPPTDKVSDPNWYMERYNDTVKQLTSDEFLDSFIQNLAKEKGIEDVNDFVTHYKGLKSNPSEYIKLHFADEAIKAGIEPVLSEEQMVQRTHQRMVEEYGEDYASRYIDKEAMNPASLSAKMLAKQQLFLAEIANANLQTKEKYEQRLKELSVPPKQFEMTDELRKEHYASAIEAGYTMDEAIALEKEMNSRSWLPDMKGLLTLKNIDKFAEVQYKKGLEDGRKGVKQAEYKAVNDIPSVVGKDEATSKITSNYNNPYNLLLRN